MIRIDTMKNDMAKDHGNVLFLILIAVALFAALSYAVTQSSRSGGGNASKETNLVNSAQLTQQPSSIRTALVRMIIGGTEVTTLEFNQPSELGTLTDTSYGVFHPDGGGATYMKASDDVMNDGAQAFWVYTADYEILNIGSTDAADSDGNDIIAFLVGVTPSVCKRINEELGISVGVDADSDGVSPAGITDVPEAADNMDNGNTGIPTQVDTIEGDFAGQPFGCFDTDDSSATADLVYYHVLVER